MKKPKLSLESISSAIPDILILLDDKGFSLDILAEDEDKLFAPRKELLKKNIRDVLPPGAAGNISRSISEALQTGALQVTGFQLSSPSGRRYFEARVVPHEEKTVVAYVRENTGIRQADHKAEEHRLRLLEHHQLLAVFNSIEFIVYVADMDDYSILFANKALQEHYDSPLTGTTCYESLQGRQEPCPFCTNRVISKNLYQPYYWEHYNPRLNAWFHLTDKVIKWPDGRNVRFEMAVDITESRKLREKLEKLAVTDELTGLWNRRHLMQAGQQEWSRKTRYGTEFALLMIDIDRFKSVNDRHGHAAGDEVLRQVANLVSRSLREPDVVARIGGEEFCVLLPSTTLENADGLARRLCAAFTEREIPFAGGSVGVTASIGVAASNDGAGDFREILGNADTALYEAKAAGRDCVMVYSKKKPPGRA